MQGTECSSAAAVGCWRVRVGVDLEVGARRPCAAGTAAAAGGRSTAQQQGSGSNWMPYRSYVSAVSLTAVVATGPHCLQQLGSTGSSCVCKTSLQ